MRCRVPLTLLPAILLAAFLALLLGGCASTPKTPRSAAPGAAPTASPGVSPSKRGGYYLDDGPGENPPDNLDQIPDPIPRVEPYLAGANRPYSVFGHEYVPDTSERAGIERGIASWYGRKFNGQRTSSGEIYDMYAMTAAHPTLPIPSYARVTNPANGRSVIVRINDRGPFHPGRIIDLSFAAAWRLGYTTVGSTPVEVERLLPRDIAAGRYAGPGASLSASVREPPRTPAEPAPVEDPRQQAAPVETSDAVVMTSSTGIVAASDLPADLVPADAPVRSARDSAAAPDLPLTGHYLQLAAFRVRSGADGFVQHLARELDPALAARLRVVLFESFYRVQLGPYSDRGEAQGAADRLKDDLGLVTLIVAPR